MSFGFGIGDILAVGQLAWTLYRECYSVARGAPQEFQVLTGEIATLSNSLKILHEEVDDPNSLLVRAGEDRVKMVNEMVARIHVTLKELQQVAKRYGVLQTGSPGKKVWARIKWSVDFRGIEGLRNKLIYHNTVMNLLLTSIGNSSLKRFQSTAQALETDIREIKAHMTAIPRPSTEHSDGPPLASVITDEAFKFSFSETLMGHAELFQPWSTIGLDQWIRAGRWWLLKAQMELFSRSTPEAVAPQAYANLVKASWILVDIIASHPQVTFLKSSSQYEVQALSSELNQEMKRITERGLKIPGWSILEKQDLRIWEMKGQAPRLVPGHFSSKGNMDSTQGYAIWCVRSERVLFQQFALYRRAAIPDPVTCIVLVLAHEDSHKERLLVQDQADNILMDVLVNKDMYLRRAGVCVVLDGGEVTFPAEKDAKYLTAVIEGSILYLGHTGMVRIDFDDLSGCIALVCIKNGCQPAILPPLEDSGKKDKSTDGSESVLAVAIDLAYQLTTNELGDDIYTNRSEETPLLVWAVLHRLHAVVRVLLSKDLEAKKLYNKSERNPLVLAVRSEDEISTRLLAEHGVSFPGVLLDAVQTGNIELLRILLATKADTIVYGDQNSPLELATRNNHEAYARLLAEHGLPGNTALLTAVEMKSEVLVGILASNGATNPLALAAAVEDVNINIVRILLAHGADPNPVVEKHKGDYDTWHEEIHWTAIHAAIHGRQTEIVQLLIANGADVNTKGWIIHSHSDYPGQGSMENQSMEWAITPLHLAVLNPSETIAEILIDNGAELDSLLLVGDDDDWQSRMDGSTPLHLAAQNGHRPLTTLLLDRGAGVNIVERSSSANGPTALFAAVSNGKEDIVQLLLSRGADPNISAEQKSLKGESPLHRAVRRGNINLVRTLVDSGADVNALQEWSYDLCRTILTEQESPLQRAASEGYRAIAQLLLDNGADINAVDGRPGVSARTALQKAREAGHSDVVQLLMDRGAE